MILNALGMHLRIVDAVSEKIHIIHLRDQIESNKSQVLIHIIICSFFFLNIWKMVLLVKK